MSSASAPCCHSFRLSVGDAKTGVTSATFEMRFSTAEEDCVYLTYVHAIDRVVVDFCASLEQAKTLGLKPIPGQSKRIVDCDGDFLPLARVVVTVDVSSKTGTVARSFTANSVYLVPPSAANARFKRGVIGSFLIANLRVVLDNTTVQFAFLPTTNVKSNDGKLSLKH